MSASTAACSEETGPSVYTLALNPEVAKMFPKASLVERRIELCFSAGDHLPVVKVDYNCGFASLTFKGKARSDTILARLQEVRGLFNGNLTWYQPLTDEDYVLMSEFSVFDRGEELQSNRGARQPYQQK